jgi:hypothetical protein
MDRAADALPTRGFLMAIMYSQNNFNKYAGIWTLKQQS